MAKAIKIFVLVLLELCLFSHTLYAFEQTVYIWQRNWDQGINTSIKQLSLQSERFSILSATISSSRGKPLISKVNTTLSYLHDAGKPVVLAIRMLSSCGKLVNTDKVNSFADEVASAVRSLIDEAVKAGVTVDGVQFDYDSPTSKLQNYRQFLLRVQSNNPDVQVSITTLPSWLDSPTFYDLVKPLAFYVLQLHSLETPKNVNEDFLLFDIDRSRRYVNKALKVGKKFFISLPTYGYEVAFDSKGQFVGLRAENKRVRWEDDIQLKVVMADPDKVAEFFKEVAGMPASDLSGVYWFRLPVEKDALNWSIKTIQAVMSGNKPAVLFKTESVVSEDGTVDVYLENTGERDVSEKVAFDVIWSSGERPLFDLVGVYIKENLKDGQGIRIVGPAPKVGERRMVAWFRAAGKKEPLLQVQTTKVTSYDGKDSR